MFNGLGRSLGLLTALALGLGVPGFDLRPGDVWPAAAPPASDGPPAGIPAPGNSAGSSTAAGTRGRSLYAGTCARGAGAFWPDGDVFL